MTTNNTYDVPVWFTIKAVDRHEAWLKISTLMRELEAHDQLPDHVVEEPCQWIADKH